MKSKELLLYTDLNLREIAAKTGFCHASNYISLFKAQEAITPDQFRLRSGYPDTARKNII
jgi:AraC-like DNA-binding protein